MMQFSNTFNLNVQLHGKKCKTQSTRLRTEAKNIIVCGEFNAAIHYRKDGEEEIIGQRVFGKGKQFLTVKGSRIPENFVDNREHLVTLARTTSTVVANTFIQKRLENKITYKAMTTDNGPPWTPERYYEIDHCLIRKCWRNSVFDITTDAHTNVNTDHCMMTVKLRQALKAKEEIKTDPSLKNISIPGGDEEHILQSFNDNVSQRLKNTGITEQRETNMADLCEAMEKAARETLQLKEPLRKRAGCHPELKPLIEARFQATKNYDNEGVKLITKNLKKTAKQK